MSQRVADSQSRITALVAALMEDDLPEPPPIDGSLAELGVASVKMVDLLLAIEAEFDIAIEVEHIVPENFSSIASLTALVEKLTR